MGSEPSSTPIGPLLVTVFSSILEVFFLCVAGYALAQRGILKKSVQTQINVINVALFTPALLFSQVAFFLTPDKLRELWILPIFFTLITAVSMSIAFVLGWFFSLKRSQWNFAIAATMFMNANSLPVALMQSLVLSVPSLRWGEDDNESAMVGRALTYLSMYTAFTMIFRWSYGVKLLSQASELESQPPPEIDENTPLLGYSDYEHERLASSSTMVEDRTPAPKPYLRQLPRRRAVNIQSFPNSKCTVFPWEVDSSRYSSGFPSLPPGTIGIETGLDLPESRSENSGSYRSFVYCLGRLIRRGWEALNGFMTAPLWATLASLFVAAVRPIQYALEEYTRPLNSAITSAGNCSIPLTLVVLGAYFYAQKEGDAEEDSAEQVLPPMNIRIHDSIRGLFDDTSSKRRSAVVTPKTPRITPGETRTIIIAIVSRMILTPLLLLPLMVVLTKYFRPVVFGDPVFIIVNVLVISSPPALTLAQLNMTPVVSDNSFERLVGRTLFWSYCIVTPPATIFYIVLGLIMAKL